MKFNFFISALIILFLGVTLNAQQRVTARGNSTERRAGVHDGNLVKSVFSNYGVFAQPTNQGSRGTWKGENNGYVGDVSPVVGLLLPIKNWDRDSLNIPDTVHHVIITPVERPGGGEYAPGGKFWGFEPIPGFNNPAVNEIGKGVAMSHQPETWPLAWPDQPTWNFTEKPIIINGEDRTPKVDWNGYFGRGRLKTATQESYFWMDDNNDEEFYQRYGFLSDSTDTSRRGSSIQVSVRGLQWGGDPVAQNVIFWLYNIKNDGTTPYDQAVFGCLVGTYVGIDGDEWNDDATFFDVREAITYTWDFDHYVRPSANPRWVPDPRSVGYIAYAFLESPGNGYDGLDNDRDNQKSLTLSPKFTETSFSERTINTGDKIVLIDKNTYQRTVKTVGAGPETVVSMGRTFTITPGVTRVNEGNIDLFGNVNPNALDGIDNDFDGIIDENYTVNYRQYKKSPAGTVLIDTINASQYFDYVANIGINDKMIDERRDDGIDNDGDWDRRYDDVGADGKAGTKDLGENDGLPTPGEPNIDQTDVDESDQLGLTSFQYFVPAGDIKMADDEDMWRRLKPGYYDVPKSIVNNIAIKGEDGDFVYGSGYFPLLPGKTERFSLALAFGDDFKDIIKTKRIVQMIYNANYTFPSPPETPTLTVVPGDKKVTLYWDRVAEESLDPVTKERDFEGYKIYKSTKYDFKDAFVISDAEGKAVAYKPIVQYDLKNGIQGYYPLGGVLRDLYKGYSPYLGDDNGIQNFYVDTDVDNGKTYFYAVTSYDRGKNDSVTFPKENSFSISRNALGKYSTTQNTGIAMPNKPVAGYVAPGSDKLLSRLSGSSTTTPSFQVMDPSKTVTTKYIVTFKDTFYVQKSSPTDSVLQGPFAVSYSVKDSLSGRILVADSRRMEPVNGEVFNGLRLSIDTSYQALDSIKLISNDVWRIHNPKPDTQKTLRVVVGNSLNLGTSIKYFYRAPRDFAIVFYPTFTDSSADVSNLLGLDVPAKTKINFRIYDVTVPAAPKRLKFGFVESTDELQDTLSESDRIFVSDETGSKLSWMLTFFETSAYLPKAGDSLLLRFYKPLSSLDRFIFSTEAISYNASLASQQMKDIRVVPNPYVVTNLYEQEPAQQLRGRGERVIKFMNLPPMAKVHIYTSSGVHVRTLEHSGGILDGSMKWDLRTKEGLEVAYGVYFYIVEADGISEKKTGKIAIIK